MHKRIAILACLGFVAALAGLSFQAPAVAQQPTGAPSTAVATTAPIAGATRSAANALVLVAKKVSALAPFDGTGTEPQWKVAQVLKGGIVQLKAVYTNDELAVLITYPDRDLTVNSKGTWNWDLEQGIWWATGSRDPWVKATDDRRRNEWLNLAFNMTAQVPTQGCNAFCHESPPGSGNLHHTTAAIGEYVDSWLLLGKHGVGSTGYEDEGWLIGVDGAVARGPIVYDTADPKGVNDLLLGNVTFSGYAEDKIIAALNDPKLAARDRPGDKYCQECHAALNVKGDPLKIDETHPMPGEVGYFGNWNAAHTAPLYIQKTPKDWADAVTITQDEIDTGDAVKVEGLSRDEIGKYWSDYKAFNAWIPQLVLKRPTGSAAAVQEVANWTNGTWIVEAKRKLVTMDKENQVQFDDPTKEYPFVMSLTDHGDMISPLFVEKAASLRFEK